MATIKSPKITCPKCRGAGKCCISPELLQTFAMVHRLKNPQATEVSVALGWGGESSTIPNRLRLLMRNGLVVRSKAQGGSFRYSIAKKVTPTRTP